MTCPYVDEAPEPARPFLIRALSDLGLHETLPNLVPGLTDDRPRPWCAAWLRRVLKDCGVPVEGSDSARELMKQLGMAGYSIDHRGPFVGGDVVGWERRAGETVIGAHVAIVLVERRGILRVLAGNSGVNSDEVTVTAASVSRVQWAARPFP